MLIYLLIELAGAGLELGQGHREMWWEILPSLLFHTEGAINKKLNIGANNMSRKASTCAIAIDSNDEILYYNQAGAYYTQGDHEKAMGELESALKLTSDFKEAQDFVSGI